MGESDQLLNQAEELIRARNLPEAERLLRQITERDNAGAEAWLMRGALEGETGRVNEAETSIRKALSLDSGHARGHLSLAHVLRATGRFDEALESARRATDLDPRLVEAWIFRSGVTGQLHRFTEAEQAAREVLDLDPGHVEGNVNLANALHHLRRLPEAEEVYRRLLEREPDLVGIQVNLANLLLATGRTGEAVELLKRATTLAPQYAPAEVNLGAGLHLLGRYEEAAAHLRRAVELLPEDPEPRLRLTLSLESLGRFDEAESALGTLLQSHPDDSRIRFRLGNLYEAQGRLDEAEAQYQWLEQELPNAADAIAARASVLEKRGRLDEAHALLRGLIDRGQVTPRASLVYARLCLARPAEGPGDAGEALRLVENQLANPQLDTGSSGELEFVLGRLYELQGDYPEAFTHFERANRAKSADYDPAEYTAYLDAVIAATGKSVLDRLPQAAPARPRMVFIVGMPRSGTSLVEQILASHTRVYGAGELRTLFGLADGLAARLGSGRGYPDCLAELGPEGAQAAADEYRARLPAAAGDAAVVTDKMPHNIHHLALIRALFPDASIVHCRRDPRDTCLSCYLHDFAGHHPYAYDLAHLGAHYRNYERLMAHWHEVGVPMLDLDYEALVDEPEPQIRRLLEYCGLEWEAQCLRFFETPRQTLTASYAQVRRPIYRDAVGRWQHYRPFLSDLERALEASRDEA